MTRQHFKALADALQERKPSDSDNFRHHQWALDVIAIARVCKQFNSGFKRERFYAACGYDSGRALDTAVNTLPDIDCDGMA